VVELDVAGLAQLLQALLVDADRVEVDRVQVLLGQGRAHTVDLAALLAVGLVPERRAEHPEGNLLALDLGFERRLEGRDLLAVLARQRAEVVLAGEAPELAPVLVAVDRRADGVGGIEGGQVGVALVDRRQLEALLQAGEVLVVLLVELGDEAVRALTDAVELLGAGRSAGHRLRIVACVSWPWKRNGRPNCSRSPVRSRRRSVTRTARRQRSSSFRTPPQA
jgi:hypothetical protein